MGDRANSIAYLADMNEPIVSSQNTNEKVYSFKLKKLIENQYNNENTINNLSLEDTNSHLIVVFESSNSNKYSGIDDLYEELNFIIDKLLYDLKYLSIENPKVNLIGHGTGGMINLKYAIEHPNNVASLYSIGTPYSGSTTYQLMNSLKQDFNISIGTNNTLNNMFESSGAAEINNSDLMQTYQEEWNAIASSANISAHAIGTSMSNSYLQNLLQEGLRLIDLIKEVISLTTYMENGETTLKQSEFYKIPQLILQNIDLISIFVDRETMKKIDILDLFGAEELGEILIDTNNLIYDGENFKITDDVLKWLADKLSLNEDKITSYIEVIQLAIKKLIFDTASIENIINIVSNTLTAMPYVNAATSAVLMTSAIAQKLASLLLAGFFAGEIADDFWNDNQIEMLITPYLEFLSDIKLKSRSNFSDYWYKFLLFWQDEIVVLNNGLVDLNSQLAQGYQGFQTYAKLYTENDNIYKMARIDLPLPLPYNLETQDMDIIDYILKNIDLNTANSSEFIYKNLSNDEVEIYGISSRYEIQQEIVVPSTINGKSVTKIAKKAFSSDRYSDVIEVVLPNSIETIGDYAFAKMDSLSTINLPTSISNIGKYAFADCVALNDINIPHSLNYLSDGIFYNTGLYISLLPDSITSVGNFAFYGNNMNAFHIGENITNIGHAAFADCQSLTNFSVDVFNSYYATKDGVLYNNSKTELISYPIAKNNTIYSLEDSTDKIGAYAFYKTNLSTITFNNGLNYIEKYAFSKANNLISISMNNVIEIGSNAFKDCGNLNEVNIYTEITPAFGWDVLAETNNDLEINVKSSLQDNYKSLLELEQCLSKIHSIKTDIHFDTNG